MRNRLFNCTNPYQGKAKKVLCVCSAGLLRSPTAAKVIGEKWGHNTRAAGLDADHALIPVDRVLLTWADEIVCMTNQQQRHLVAVLQNESDPDMVLKEVICLNIPDSFGYCDPELIKLIESNYKG